MKNIRHIPGRTRALLSTCIVLAISLAALSAWAEGRYASTMGVSTTVLSSCRVLSADVGGVEVSCSAAAKFSVTDVGRTTAPVVARQLTSASGATGQPAEARIIVITY